MRAGVICGFVLLRQVSENVLKPVADAKVGSDTGLDTSVVAVKANAVFSVEGGLKYDRAISYSTDDIIHALLMLKRKQNCCSLIYGTRKVSKVVYR